MQAWTDLISGCRNVVIALLRAKGSGSGLRKIDIMEASKIALKTEVPQATYQKVLIDARKT